MEKTIPSSVYGPVRSWRLGSSLGVDLLSVDSICSFSCVYCQLGKIHRLTTKREIFVSTARVVLDLKNSDWRAADVITFSGSGEPTLAKNIGEVIKEISLITEKPMIVLTNSSLLKLPEVRREIKHADKIFCKLDACHEEMLQRIDRPHKDLSLERIISGVRLLREEYKGFLAIQTMILRPLNDSELKKFSQILCSIKPDEVQLNLPARPVPPDYLIESRGNTVKVDDTFTNLKTVSKTELGITGRKLSELTGLPIITSP